MPKAIALGEKGELHANQKEREREIYAASRSKNTCTQKVGTDIANSQLADYQYYITFLKL